MIYSRMKVASVLLFLVAFYALSIYNMQFYLTFTNVFVHFNMSHELFITPQKLLLNMTMLTTFLLFGFEHKYHYVFRLIRIRDDQSLVLLALRKNGLLSLFIATQVIIVQTIFLTLNGLHMDFQVLVLTFMIVLIYSYSMCSLYTLLYGLTLKHVLSLSVVALFRLMLLVFVTGLDSTDLSETLSVGQLFYLYIIVEVVLVNIFVVYVLRDKERFAL